jgi:hypothetical protein
MDKHIKIEFTVNQEQYKDYENIIQELLNNLIDIGIDDTDIKELNSNFEDYILGSLEEIDGICIGADSPDANTLMKKNPKKACEYMYSDIAEICNIVTDIQKFIRG